MPERMVTGMNEELLKLLKSIGPMDIVKWSTALAVVFFWVLAILTAILYMVGYY
jgi:hypothetical protein